jgi:inner membrane protein
VASAFAHAVAAVTLASAWVKRPKLPVRFWVLGAACAMGSDLDVLGYWLGIPYGHMLGHRGLTHSLPFAAAVSPLVVWVGFSGPEWVRIRPQLLSYFFVATASHGVFDAMTDNGLGVAFFAPFEPTRYFFPFRPLPTFPLSVANLTRVFLSAEAYENLAKECVWVGGPCLLLGLAARLVRR